MSPEKNIDIGKTKEKHKSTITHKETHKTNSMTYDYHHNGILIQLVTLFY